ncbi:MAG: exosome complex protein Rrp42 [Nanoarchaeota archaeon]
MELTNITKKQIEELLKKDKRMDGRTHLDYRELEIETNISKNAEGTARVRLGKTEVIVGVKMDVQIPYPDHDDEGTMMVGMEFSPISGGRYENGPPKIDSIEVARVVDRGLRESGFIDWKKLCIKEKEKVWCVLIDIYCINDDGNLLDASSIAAVAALKMTRFPVYDEETEKVKYGEFTKEALPLTDNVPLSITFHKIGSSIIVDPTRNEEDTSEARVTFAISKAKKDHMINAMQKGNMQLVSGDELIKMIENVEKIYDNLFPKIEKKIKALKK